MTNFLIEIKELIWKVLYKYDSDFLDSHTYDKDKKIQELHKELSEAVMKYADLSEKHFQAVADNKVLIKGLRKQIAVLKDPHEDIDKPTFLNDMLPYIPKTRISTKDGEKTIILQPLDIYTSSSSIKSLVSANRWNEMYANNKTECAHKIWEYVIKSVSYESDKEEDWRPSMITKKYAFGDCEDTTILFIDLCKEAGFRPDEIFNVCGYFTRDDAKFGHSWPIVNTGDGWYVYETTLTKVPAEPKKFLGSKYTADWGLSNWAFSGKLTQARKQI